MWGVESHLVSRLAAGPREGSLEFVGIDVAGAVRVRPVERRLYLRVLEEPVNTDLQTGEKSSIRIESVHKGRNARGGRARCVGAVRAAAALATHLLEVARRAPHAFLGWGLLRHRVCEEFAFRWTDEGVSLGLMTDLHQCTSGRRKIAA